MKKLSKRTICISICSFVLLALIVFFSFHPVMSLIFERRARRSTDFRTAITYLERAYRHSQRQALRDLRVELFLQEARRVLPDDPELALELLREIFAITPDPEVLALMMQIFIERANFHIEYDPERALQYIITGLSYDPSPELLELAARAYALLALRDGLHASMEGIDEALEQLPEETRNHIKDGVQRELLDPETYPDTVAGVLAAYLQALAVGNNNIARIYEYFGDRTDLYFPDQNLVPAQFIPRDTTFRIVRYENITEQFRLEEFMDEGTPLAPIPDQAFYRVYYTTDNMISEISVTVMAVLDEEDFWKIYAIT